MSATTTVAVDLPGIYVFKLTADDGDATSTDLVAITVGESAPTVTVTITPPVEVGSAAGLRADVSTDGTPWATTVTWSKVSGPGDVTFGPATQDTTRHVHRTR